MSLTNPNKVVTEQRLNEYHNAILPYLGGTAEAGFTPVGTVIAVMGNTAPANYLACNGQVVNIADYSILADYFEAQFGTKNHFGGDGTTTFAVPDLRGEFLRGTGSNSHSGQGNGSSVGVHQDGTTNLTIWCDSDNFGVGGGVNSVQYDANNYPKNLDYVTRQQYSRYIRGEVYIADSNNKYSAYYTSRPTNTSVLYCIATHNIFMNPELQYSTQEQVVGTWIDGKPIYQKTILTNTPASDSEVTRVNIGALIDKVIDIKAIFYNANGTSYSMMATNANADKIVRANVQTNICVDVSIRNSVEIYATQPSWLDIPCHITIQYTKATN